MVERLAALIIDESKWLPVAMALAVVAVAAVLLRHRGHRSTRVVMAAMNLFAGVMLATMGVGHLLAVTTRLVLGTLDGTPVVLYPIGIAVIVPAGLLVAHARGMLAGDAADSRTTRLNAWMAVTLLALGLHNLPLAAPSLLNIGYRLHQRRAIGWAIVSVAVVFNLGLFIGAVIFMASGQSFEQFSGME